MLLIRRVSGPPIRGSKSNTSPITVRKPELPLALLFTGDGTWKNPYRLDLDDTLVASVPNLGMLSKFIDQSWLQFLCELNATLRTIRPSDLEGSMGRTLKLLDEYDSDELGGLRIRLAKFHPSGTRRLGIMLDLQPRTATNSLNLTGTIGGSSYNLKATEAEHAHGYPRQRKHYTSKEKAWWHYTAQ